MKNKLMKDHFNRIENKIELLKEGLEAMRLYDEDLVDIMRTDLQSLEYYFNKIKLLSEGGGK